ncbi:hypothetical protein F0562_023564 [Nyssa sinensis]|uniref:TCP domain-containing protein n=1 Tax=Nyssa sinensis TaxID=561372 RepID=A0A5J5BJ58_9ASTE|nr:hypothetical protein F0562_023564 [Nyssa sinensis]
MYPSSSNGNNPVSYTPDHTISHRPFFSDINSNSKQDQDPPSSFFHLPSPYIHYEEDMVFLQHLHDLLQQQPLTTADNTVTEAVIDIADSNKDDGDGPNGVCNRKCDSATEQVPRKRSSKKDRHSKINTAHGPRDRRMRLSLEVARKFFDLQDMLGFDKASKTVEWLLTKSKAAIKELARGLPQIKHSCSTVNGANSSSSTSECEVISGIDHESSIDKNPPVIISKGKPSASVAKEKKIRTLRKSSFHPLARESRDKARARARERTREKIRKLDESKLCFEPISHDLNQLGSWSTTFETGEESGTQNHNMNPSSFEVLAHEVEEPSRREQEHPGIKQDIFGDSLAITGNWSPSIIFNSQHNTGISQEHQSTDFQFYGKPYWEGYNSRNLL